MTAADEPSVPRGITADHASADAAVDEIDATRRRLLAEGRRMVGVSGTADAEPLRTVLRRHHVGIYPLVAVSVLAFVDGFQGLVVGVMGPEISRALGMSRGSFAGLLLLKSLTLAVSTIVFAHVVGKRPVRAAVSISAAFAWSGVTLLTGLVRTPAGFAAVNVADGATGGATGAAHTPLLLDIYPPEVRMRIVACRTAFLQATGLAAPLLVAVLVGGFDLTWRGALIVLGAASVIGSIVSVGLRDPGYGRWDTDRIRSLVHDTDAESHSLPPGDAELDPQAADPSLGFFEASRRIWLIPTMRKVLIASIVASMAAVPIGIYFPFFLAERWGLDAAGRSLFATAVGVVGVVAIPLMAPVGERLYAKDPQVVMRFVMRVQFLALGLGTLAIVSPVFPVMLLAHGLSASLPNAISPVVSTTVMNIVPSRMRSHLIALLGIASLGGGGALGTLVIAGLDRRVGLTWAMLLMTIPSVIALLLFRSAARDVDADLDATVESIIEQEEIAALRRLGRIPPLLACRKVDFSYGRLQVLFDVDFTVDSGELVALLGTNGAGKSTLLGVISGLNLPSSGTVRLDGADITYIDTERRVGLGVTQVFGGRATFGPLTVAENLRTFGWAHGKQKATIERGIDESLAAFPRLAERRNQLAATLSGGEQQMLGLAQALILKPRLLCIDELSLGLAPKIVAELMEMVRRINAAGTAVVLVEQSATVALSLVDHAYFMERGQVRFDGAAADLLGRDDLLRSVFLKGVGAALAVDGNVQR